MLRTCPKCSSYRFDCVCHERFPVGLAVILTGILAFLFFAGPAWSEEMRTALIRNAYMCDTVEQLQTAIETVKPQDAALPDIDGCGYLARPVMAGVEEVMVFETDWLRVGIVALHIPQLGTQYSYTHFLVLTQQSL